MSPQSRTNQLLFHAELLLAVAPGDDEQAQARRMATEEGALATAELALESLLREVTEHALLERHDWRELLGPGGAGIAELARLRELAVRPDSWLAWLLARLEALHGCDGVARRDPVGSALIATGTSLAEELRWCLREAKVELAALRQTSAEW